MTNTRTRSVRAGIVVAISSGISLMCNAANVVTHHMDNFRTGWNPQETVLTSSNVNSSTFSQQAIAEFDGQVDAQPLVLTNQAINGTTYPIVVYVVTENNSVYAVNGTSGAILAQVSLGAVVNSNSIPPGTCNNNSTFMGINSTPVIDTSSGTLYVVTTTTGSGTINHYLHALSTSTLADTVAALEIAPPGSITYSRQRSALTLFNGGVLIPFASFCDNNPTTTRGYIVYANMSGTATQTSFETSYYNLASIWMSGSGPAVNGNSIYLATGNGSAPYPPANNNLAESLVLLTGSSGSPLSLTYSGSFTPSNYQFLDQNDQDFGAGGVLLVPSGAPTSITPSTPVQFVTAVAKNGGFYVNSPTLLNDQTLSLGNCWCGTSFFTGGDATGHVVLSAGSQIQLTNVSAGGLGVTASVSVPGANGNMFTTISSNGAVAGTGVIWTVTGPDSNYQLNLHAYSANSLTPLYSSAAGWWSNTGGLSNTVPVVANGHVYVASNSELLIWGESTGPLPAPPTNISSDGSTDCPLMDVSWNASAGATSYNVYYQPYGAAINGSRRTKYTGSATSVSFPSGGNQIEMITVTACNANGCSDPSAPIFGEVFKPCP